MKSERTVEVQLVFTGICSLLIGEDGSPAAVMPNARNSSHGAHIPWIIIAKRNWAGAPPFQLEHDGQIAWFLGNEDISLEGATPGPVTKYDDKDYGQQPTPQNAASIHWATPAKKVLTDDEIKAAYLMPGDPAAVSQWLHLPGGVLRTAAVRDCVWDLKAEAPGSPVVLTQALAQEVELVTQVQATDRVTLVSRDMDSGNEIRRDVLLTGQDSIRILFGNTPEDDVFPNKPPQPVDHHFFIYRRVFKNAPTHDKWPIPHMVPGRCPANARVHVSKMPAPERLNGQNCPPILVF